MKINVTYFFRKPFADYFSIEELFGFIQSALPGHIVFRNYYLKRYSKGWKDRLLSCFEVIPHQSDINHITGDIHFVAFFMRKRRTVLTIHDLEVLRRLKGVSRFVVWLFWFYLPALRVRYITVISGFTKEVLLKEVRISPDKVVVIHNCVSPAIQYKPKPFNTVRPNILHIGTAHNKNLERLIEAIAGMPVHLTILGHLRDHQLQLLQQYNVEYTNYFNLSYDKVVELYQACDLVSFVSLYEGFGMPIIEAQATGRPVVTSNCTSMPEVAGEGALIVDPTRTGQIREAISRIISDEALRGQLVEKGLENVKRFTPAAIAARYAQLYEQMLNS
ncbi:MAG: glycosyltransferase family 4 protein [Bacteroidetes bacterium]|nr:glycosyltransferase family 4 protein [Bacteroidota bacterium]